MAGFEGDESLRHRARVLICAGILPSRPPMRLWGGKGSGARCAVCERTIDSCELEFELEFDFEIDRGGPRENERALFVHAGCFAIWDGERSVKLAGGTGLEPVTPAV